MKLKSFYPLLTLALVNLSLSNVGQAQTTSPKLSELSQEVATLRKQGPAGLQIFLASHARELASGVPAAEIRTALDALCQQRDCYASQLYWYTDWDQAKAAAQASGKPILSLRLLGRLDQDLSCANSRFFRVALYPNAKISRVLRDRFILHWQSVRPVPKVTIDFGDGRKLERTITGNSIHYVLDQNGRPIDAIPGLYGPQAFLRQLQQAEEAVKDYSREKTESNRESFLRQYHRDRLAAIQNQWATDLSKVGITALPKLTALPQNPNQPATAAEAGKVAYAKMIAERPIVRSLQSAATQNREALSQITDQAAWEKLAQLHAADARLDQNSLSLMRSKKFFSRQDTHKKAEVDLLSVARQFEAAMAIDAVRNEYVLHSQIHQWFTRDFAFSNVEPLNERVYAQLFLTPSTDPWLGLSPTDTYSAIENDGIRQ
ncbi:hypothetical protein K9N68_11065 [Kovacikia minuta CCNUW1]|uniref:hypothetical protein n=1 Tax=Kovacikia minuta TaxID=2931930 RepID=UPI001CCA501E|nr:hypothetical protein [Kovacikia minuta]UBF28364.1 hypothetical protein K9N68_11065 [Kovacikia minuta CCNUW1]